MGRGEALPGRSCTLYIRLAEGFCFGVKLPDALTLTHVRPVRKGEPLVVKQHFLLSQLLGQFIERLEPLREKFGPLMLQFG